MRKRSKMGTQGSEIGGLFNRAVGRSERVANNIRSIEGKFLFI
jgi:hypothetical protein